MKTSVIFFFLLLACHFSAVGQGDSAQGLVSTDHYSLHVTIDNARHLLRAEAIVRLHVQRGAVSRVVFDFGAPTPVTSARDTSGKELSIIKDAEGLTERGRRYSIVLPDTLHRGDTTEVTLSFERSVDSVSSAGSFIDEHEFALLPGDGDRWWPVWSPEMTVDGGEAASASLGVTLRNGFVPVSTKEPDTSFIAGEERTWEFNFSAPVALNSCFLICGGTNLVRQTIDGADTSSRLSLFFDPARFSPELASAVLGQLRSAKSFYERETNCRTRPPDVRVVIVGADEGHGGWLEQNGTIVGRNSLAYSLADTSVLLSSEMSTWVYSLAEEFGIRTADSSAWMSEGWAEFLATRFFLENARGNASLQRQIRLSLLSRILDFYPLPALAQTGRLSPQREALLSHRGAYFFLMLEYIMGEHPFDTLMSSIVKQSGTAPVGLTELERESENAYGSSLAWFFTEWMNQTSFPELVLSTDITQTNRGNYSVKATISQRGDVFSTPVDIVFSNNVRSITKRVIVTRQDQRFEFILPFLPVRGELDPNFYLLRWVPRLRLLAHARSSVTFRLFDRDLPSSDREAEILLQLDPNNLTGWNNLALFSLGKSSVIRGDLTKAEEYFRRASSLEASDPTLLYSVLSLVRLGNVLEMEGKREEAIDLYKLSATLASRRTAVYGYALSEAEKYLHNKFQPSDDFWYGEY